MHIHVWLHITDCTYSNNCIELAHGDLLGSLHCSSHLLLMLGGEIGGGRRVRGRRGEGEEGGGEGGGRGEEEGRGGGGREGGGRGEGEERCEGRLK